MRSLRAALIKVGMFSGTNVLLVEARSGRAAKQSSIRNGGMVVVGGYFKGHKENIYVFVHLLCLLHFKTVLHFIFQ